jgi:hypothetical protein
MSTDFHIVSIELVDGKPKVEWSCRNEPPGRRRMACRLVHGQKNFCLWPNGRLFVAK